MAEPAEELELAQPMELFDEGLLPVRNDLVDMVKARSFVSGAKPPKHTGKLVIRQMLNDEELCESVCTALLAGLSARLIGKRFAMSPKSVANIRDAMEERGELAPVRTRIQRKLDRVTELGLEAVEDGLLNGQIHPGQAWIPTLASVDKREQLSVGLVPGTERTRASVTIEQVLAEHALAKAALPSPSDSPSRALPSQATAPQAVQLSDAGPATGPATAPQAVQLADAGPATAPRPEGPAAADGGGGVTAAPASPDARGDGPQNFQP